MSTNQIGSFYRGDTLRVKCTLVVDGQPEPLAGASITLALLALGAAPGTLPVWSITQVVPAGAAADAGEFVFQATGADTLAPPGRYDALLIRTRSATDRWTFHGEQVQVFKGAL